MSNPFSFSKNPNASKEAALKAARESAATSPPKPDAITKWIDPANAAERIYIEFDDSGSMSSEIENAKEGVVEFFRNCIPNQTAVYVKMICGFNPDIEKWNSNLIQAAGFVKNAHAGLGGTPLFEHMNAPLNKSIKPTRIVVFSDGDPTDHLWAPQSSDAYKLSSLERQKKSADIVIEHAKELHITIDTVFFGENSEWNQDSIALLKYIAEQSGGYFLHFDPKKVNFRTAFKYLAPVNRLMLASESVRREIESGTRS